MNIRSEQFQLLEKTSNESFREELAAHLHRIAPRHVQQMGKQNLSEFIQKGIAIANSHYWKSRGAIWSFIECQVSFGYRFDTDPLIPWNKRFFANTGKSSVNIEVVNQMYEKATLYRKLVIGQHEEFEKAAMNRLLNRSPEQWFDFHEIPHSISSLCQQIWPEKAEHAPKGALEIIDRESAVESGLYCLDVRDGRRLIGALKIAFGHRVTSDLQHDWIRRELMACASLPLQRRAKRVAARVIAYLSDSLDRMNRGVLHA